MKVVVLGGTGNTGRSIINGLLESETKFEITALTRPSSLEKPETLELKSRGIKIVPVDLGAIAASYKAPHPGDVSPPAADPELVKILTGVDVVISAIFFLNLPDQIPFIDAAKAAGVGRFVPCNFGTVGPRGVMALADAKYAILDHIQRIRQPYTVIEVGWWYQISLPRVPSGKLDASKGNGLVYFPAAELVGGRAGAQPSALTDLRDIGRWVALIVAAGDKTLNKTVFSYAEVRTQTEVWDLVEKLTGEKPVGEELSAETLGERIAKIDDKSRPSIELSVTEYQRSWGLRGDNTPENAAYLGFVSARELFPDFKPLGLEDFIKEALA